MAHADGTSSLSSLASLAIPPHATHVVTLPAPPHEPASRLVFVKVHGFTDVERHALNTVFRLSRESDGRGHAFALWTREAPTDAELVLIDGDNWEAALELAKPANDRLRLVWIGIAAPSRANLVFHRPLQWPAVVEGMDRLLGQLARNALTVLHDIALPADLAAAPAQPVDAEAMFGTPSSGGTGARGRDLDIDLSDPSPISALDTQPLPLAGLPERAALAAQTGRSGNFRVVRDSTPTALATGVPTVLPTLAVTATSAHEHVPDPASAAVTEPGGLMVADDTLPEHAQALVVDADEAARLYWRAKLALAGVMQVHEACCGAEALQMMQAGRYRLVILDLSLRDMSGWELIGHARRGRTAAMRRTHDVLILTGHRLSWLQGVRGWLAGARSCVRKPFHPGNLHHLLLNMR